MTAIFFSEELYVLRLQLHRWLPPWEPGSQLYKPSLPVIASHAVRPLWPIYGILPEVANGQLGTLRPQAKPQGLGESRPLKAQLA